MKVTIGVIGFGWMAYYHYRNILPKQEDFSIVSSYDIDPERRQFCEKLGMKSYDNLDAFLSDPSFATVLVATPNNFHKEMCIACMRAGKNVICEKPVAMNAAETEEMIEVSEETGVIFTVHQNRRRDRDYKSVRKVIAERTIGDIFLIESRVDGSNGIPSDWRRVKESGGGMLLDWGPHLIDQLLLLDETPLIEVHAQMQKVAYDVDDNFQAHLTFQDGLSMLAEVSTACFLPLPRWHVLGSNGTLDILNFKNEGKIRRGTVKEVDWSIEQVENYAGSTRTMRPRPDNTIETFGNPEAETDWEEFYYNYQRVLEGKDKLLVDPHDSLRVMKVIDLIRQSAEEGHSIQCLL